MLRCVQKKSGRRLDKFLQVPDLIVTQRRESSNRYSQVYRFRLGKDDEDKRGRCLVVKHDFFLGFGKIFNTYPLLPGKRLRLDASTDSSTFKVRKFFDASN